MRLAGQAKMGYYRTPDSVVDLIRSKVIMPDKPFAATDPCCGEGLALARMFEGTPAITYGVELDDERSKEASTRVNKVLHSGIEECSVTHKAFSVLWLNPPYDWEHSEEGKKCERKEMTFLRRSFPWLAEKGLLVFIIPESVWTDKMQGYLATRLINGEVWRFPEPEYSDFGQIVVMGQKKEADDAVTSYQPLTISQPTLHYQVPQTSSAIKLFRSSRVDKAEIERLMPNSPVWRNFWSRVRGHDTIDRERRPPLSLHSGHLTLLLASGLVDGVVGHGEEAHVIKGKVTKGKRVSSELKVSDDGERSWTITKELDEYRVSIKLLDRSGTIREVA